VNVVRHDDVTADGPAVNFGGIMPRLNESVGDLRVAEDWPAFLVADGYKVERVFNPHIVQATQMLPVWHNPL
jgi:hypothetical protein